MPCRDDGYEQQERAEQASRHHRVTKILCELMGQLEAAGILSDYSSNDGHSWWSDHKAADRKREYEEKAARIREEKELRKEILERQKRLAEIAKAEGR